MCAGKGIIHAEMPVHQKGSPDPRGLQLWVDLPKQVRLYLNCFSGSKLTTRSIRWWYVSYSRIMVARTERRIIYRILAIKNLDLISKFI